MQRPHASINITLPTLCRFRVVASSCCNRPLYQPEGRCTGWMERNLVWVSRWHPKAAYPPCSRSFSKRVPRCFNEARGANRGPKTAGLLQRGWTLLGSSKDQKQNLSLATQSCSSSSLRTYCFAFSISNSVAYHIICMRK